MLHSSADSVRCPNLSKSPAIPVGSASVSCCSAGIARSTSELTASVAGKCLQPSPMQTRYSCARVTPAMETMNEEREMRAGEMFFWPGNRCSSRCSCTSCAQIKHSLLQCRAKV